VRADEARAARYKIRSRFTHSIDVRAAFNPGESTCPHSNLTGPNDGRCPQGSPSRLRGEREDHITPPAELVVLPSCAPIAAPYFFFEFRVVPRHYARSLWLPNSAIRIPQSAVRPTLLSSQTV
jgi:hypothetical protein